MGLDLGQPEQTDSLCILYRIFRFPWSGAPDWDNDAEGRRSMTQRNSNMHRCIKQAISRRWKTKATRVPPNSEKMATQITSPRVFRRTDDYTPSTPRVQLLTEALPALTPPSLLIGVHAATLNYRDANIVNRGNRDLSRRVASPAMTQQAGSLPKARMSTPSQWATKSRRSSIQRTSRVESPLDPG
jgi:hypothetical protein